MIVHAWQIIAVFFLTLGSSVFSGMAGSFIGGYTGSHIAIQKSEKFAKYALATFMLVSGIWLIASA